MTAWAVRGGGLQIRLMAIVAVGALLFALAGGAVAYVQGVDRANAVSRKSLEDLARAVEGTVSIGAYAKDTVLLNEVVAGLAHNALVMGARVDGVGDVLVATERGRQQARMSVERPLYSPFDAAERTGTLVILADDRIVAQAASREATTLAGMMAAQAALLALLLYGVTAKLVTAPIIRLADRMRSIRPGSDERLALPTRRDSDEIGVLIEGANTLLASTASALRQERDLREQVEALHAQYRRIFESSSAGIFVIDRGGRLINSNPTVARVVGMSVEDLSRLEHESFVKRVFARPERVEAMIERSLEKRETVTGDLELRGDGPELRWVHCLISVQGTREEEGDLAVEGVMYDVTDRRTAEYLARYGSEHDALTRLKNRAGSHAAIDRLVDEALRNQAPLALIYIDLDGFKFVNDRHGHGAGDHVLTVCADRMREAVRRKSDLVGRVGGDEFVIALRDTGPEDHLLVATALQLLEALGQSIQLPEGACVQVGASLGIATLPRDGTNRENLTTAADRAMYEVKRSGKNAVAMAFRPSGAAREVAATP